MAWNLAVWQLALLAAVCAADLVVFVGLCFDEVRGWGYRSPWTSRRTRASDPAFAGLTPTDGNSAQ